MCPLCVVCVLRAWCACACVWINMYRYIIYTYVAGTHFWRQVKPSITITLASRTQSMAPAAPSPTEGGPTLLAHVAPTQYAPQSQTRERSCSGDVARIRRRRRRDRKSDGECIFLRRAQRPREGQFGGNGGLFELDESRDSRGSYNFEMDNVYRSLIAQPRRTLRRSVDWIDAVGGVIGGVLGYQGTR